MVDSTTEKEVVTVRQSLTVKDAAQALEFYTKAFGAVELFRMEGPDGSVVHAEFMIGNSQLFISAESADWYAFAMPEGAMASCLFTIASEDCEASHQKAIAAGAVELVAPVDQFWGSRTSVVKDPHGYRWAFGQILEVITPEEMKRRAAELFGGI